MPDIERLHLEDALEDSPQTRRLLSVFEQDTSILKKYSTDLHLCCKRILNAQNELCAATQALSQHLSSYERQKFPLETEGNVLATTLKQFASYLDDVSSVQQVLCTQLTDGMMYPLSRFLQADVDDIGTMNAMFLASSNDLDQTMARYMKVKKKDSERLRQECAEELFSSRKKFHQIALHYYSGLNAMQYKRKCSLLEPVLGYMQAQRAFFQMGKDALCKSEIDEFLSNISASIQGVQSELNSETQNTVDLVDTLEHQCAHLYPAEPGKGQGEDMPFIPPNTNISQKSGYLFIRRPQLLSSRWERQYFFTQCGNLMVQNREELAGGLCVDLNEGGVNVEAAESEDRRFVFAVNAPISSKKSVILQAENERDRDEWIAAIQNTIEDDGFVKEATKLQQRSQSLSSAKTRTSAEGSAATTAPDKREAIRASSVSSARSSISSSHSSATTPLESFFLDTPIQFDIITPSDENRPITAAEGPPKRINPFDSSSTEVVLNDPNADNAAFSQHFIVRFCGSMEVQTDRGEQLVLSTIRQIMAARAIHNIFRMTQSTLVVSSDGIRLLDPSNNSLRTEFILKDVSYWSPHKENKRLFGFITRNRATAGNPTFACHVFECDVSADEICDAIHTATTIAFQILMEQHASDRKKTMEQMMMEFNVPEQIMLANINLLDSNERKDEDAESKDSPLPPSEGRSAVPGQPETSPLPPSSEGRSAVPGQCEPTIEETKSAAELNPPITQYRGDGDERKVEGAECETDA